MSLTPKYGVLDAKLRHLVQLCLETNNNKKLSIVFINLIINHVRETGIRMGFSQIIEEQGKNAWICMEMINDSIEKKLGKGIFKTDMIEKTKKLEKVFEKAGQSIPIKNIPELIGLYYDLRKIEAPNFSHVKSESFQKNKSDNMLIFNSLTLPQNRNSIFSFKKERTDIVKNLLLREIKQKQANLENSLNKRYDKNQFEELYQLKSCEENLKNNNNNKIKCAGNISSNIFYKRSTQEIPGYFLLGTSIASILFFILLLIQNILHPEISEACYGMSLLFFVLILFTLAIYWFIYLKEGHS
ncbi:MAG: hypothetical protein JW891_08045 [Candidatus Lokiarchaeota archaeon]|nr:hypothetical protein [Candidatus Lokiarchaeota archaeon]